MDAKEQSKKILWALYEAARIGESMSTERTIIKNGLNEYHQAKLNEEPVEPDQWPQITAAELCEHISHLTGVNIEDIRSKDRDPNIVKARATYYYLGRSIYKFRFNVLGYYTNRGHCNAMHHYKKYSELTDSRQLWYNKELDMELRKIKARLYERLITNE